MKSTEISSDELQSERFQQFFHDLEMAMVEYDGIGIAAPQVGMTKRAIVISKDYAAGERHLVLINPRITALSKRTASMEEGCLSVPGVVGMVERPVKARVKASFPDGSTADIKAKGMLARILQHEIDHLDGVLFIDKAESTSTTDQAASL